MEKVEFSKMDSDQPPSIEQQKAQRPKGTLYGMCSLIIIPWLAFNIVVLCVTTLWHHAAIFVVAGIVALCYFGFALTATRTQENYYNMHLGWLMIGGALAGFALGHYNYELHMANYYTFWEGRLYTNVLANEPGAAHADASAVVFNQLVRVDPVQGRGYYWQGTDYCVAPIVDQNMASEIQYWAVGLNCCNERGSFNCGDMADPTAHAGIVIHDDHLNHDMWMKAVRVAEADWDLDTAEFPLLVEWRSGPFAGRDDALKYAMIVAVISGAASFFFAILFGAGAHYFAKQGPIVYPKDQGPAGAFHAGYGTQQAQVQPGTGYAYSAYKAPMDNHYAL